MKITHLANSLRNLKLFEVAAVFENERVKISAFFVVLLPLGRIGMGNSKILIFSSLQAENFVIELRLNLRFVVLEPVEVEDALDKGLERK